MTRKQGSCMQAAHGGGFDCQQCALHVDECIEESERFLQDERFVLEKDYQETEHGRVLSTISRRTRLYTDSARDSSRRASLSSDEEMDLPVFHDAPLSNARQPDLKTFTFRNSTAGELTKPIVVYNVIHRSPRFTIKTIPQKVASSTESSVASVADSEEISVGGDEMDYSADVEGTEMLVDWPQNLEPDEISVDGPEIASPDYSKKIDLISSPEAVGSRESKYRPLSPKVNTTNSSRPDSAQTRSPRIPNRRIYPVLPERTSSLPRSDTLSPSSSMAKTHVPKSTTEVNLYKIFYPERLTPAQLTPSPFDPNLPVSVHLESVQRLLERKNLVLSETTPVRRIFRPDSSLFSDDGFPSPPPLRERSPSPVSRPESSTKKRWYSVETPIRDYGQLNKRTDSEKKPAMENLDRNVVSKRPSMLDSEATGNDGSVVDLTTKRKPVVSGMSDQVVERNVITVTPTAGDVAAETIGTAPAKAGAHQQRPAASVILPASQSPSISTSPSRQHRPESQPPPQPEQVQVHRQQKQLFGGYEIDDVQVRSVKVDLKQSPPLKRNSIRRKSLVVDEEYVTKESLPKEEATTSSDKDMSTAATITYANAVGGNQLKSSAPSFAASSQLQRFLNSDREERASISSSTLPYSVDGSKVIYPTRSQQPGGYTSSRVSTVSELDGYPTSPSPSIPESGFSALSRASGRHSRRSHATVYLKSNELDPKKREPRARSQVDLTVESEVGLPIEELEKYPSTLAQQFRRSSTSSSTGRGVQKLTIKMTLRESKSSLEGPSAQADESTTTNAPTLGQLTQVRSADSAISVSPPANRNTDDLPNGATAASTIMTAENFADETASASYQRSQHQLLPSKLELDDADNQHHRRSVASSYSTTISKLLNPASRRSRSESKAKLSASQVELFKPEVIMTDAPPQTEITASRASVYERQPLSTHESVSSRMYTPASERLVPTKAIPYRSYERLDIKSEDGGHVMREVVEELKNNVISIKVHEKGDHLSKERAQRLEKGEDPLVQPIEQTVPTIEKALTAGKEGAFVLPEKPASPRSRRDKYELHQAMSWKREFVAMDDEVVESPAPTATEIEYPATFQPQTNQSIIREEYREAESRAVSAPARASPVQERPRWNHADHTDHAHNHRHPSPPRSTMTTKNFDSYRDDRNHVSYRSIFDKCFVEERVEELRKSASDLRALAGDTDRPFKSILPSTSYKPDTFTKRPSSSTTYQATPYTQRPTLPSYDLKSNIKCDYPPAVPPRTSSSNYDTYSTYSDTRKSETYTKTGPSVPSYKPPEPTKSVRDMDYKHITQYKSSPILSQKSVRDEEPTYESSMWKTTDSFTYKPRTLLEVKTTGNTTPPKPSFESYDPKPTSTKAADKLSGYSSRYAQAESAQATYQVPESPYRVGIDRSDSAKPTEPVVREPKSKGTSWAYAYKLPPEEYRASPIENSRDSEYRSSPTKTSRPSPSKEAKSVPIRTVEPAVIEALRTKKPEPPSSPDIRPKDWVPPCKAKILQAKRKYMQQPIQSSNTSAGQGQDPFDKYKYGSRDRMQLRMSQESLNAINREAYRGRSKRDAMSSAPDLRGSQKTLADPSVYRSKIQWPEREIQAKLSASQEYLTRKYNADYDDQPTTSSFANRWDARSRSLPPMSRYSKSAAATPMESPFPEYLDSNKAKSMEFIADVKKYDYRIVPENQLQRENLSGYSRSRHLDPEVEKENPYIDQVRKSLQKLDLPDWYVNSPYSQPGVMEGTILRNRANSTAESNYSPYNTLDRSDAASPTYTFRSTEIPTIPRTHGSRRSSRPDLSTSREERVWDGYTGPFYDKKKTRPTAIYSPASEIRPHYNPHDSGWSSDWNSHPESSPDSDGSNTDRHSPRAWNSTGSSRKSNSDWYQNPLKRTQPSQSSYPRPTDLYSRPTVRPEPAGYVDARFPGRRVLQATPWEVTSVKTETFKKENLTKKTFLTETNDPAKINQFSQDASMWGSYV